MRYNIETKQAPALMDQDQLPGSVEIPPRILIADDDLDLLQAMQRCLRLSFDVTVASDGEEAIRLLTSRGPFAVVIADLRMPGIDGVGLLFSVRHVAPRP